MRSVFDQYEQHENRLTHALACCLHQDPLLLRAFVSWVIGSRAPKKLAIIEQGLPDVDPVDAEELRTSLPDAWITGATGWCLLIESKVTARLELDQLRRHVRTARRQGFTDVHVLALVLGVRSVPDQDGVTVRSWTEVYDWFRSRSAGSQWAKLMSEYMEAFERRASAEGHLKEGTVTRFSGIDFTDDNPYTYREAKRLLRLALDELRVRGDLKKLGVDQAHPGRSAITGSRSRSVWDFLSLRTGLTGDTHTRYPHLTLEIGAERVTAMVTIPNGLERSLRRNLTRLDLESFTALLLAVRERLLAKGRGQEHGSPRLYLLQRHFLSQRSAGIVDARLEFDLRTMGGSKSPVRSQPEWVEAVHRVIANRKANIQMGIGISYPAGADVLRTRAGLDHIAAAWVGCEPLLALLLRSGA